MNGNKILFWVMGIIGTLFTAGAIGWASHVSSEIDYINNELLERQGRITKTETLVDTIVDRLTRIERKLDRLINKERLLPRQND